MVEHDASSATLRIFTRKEGVLSKVAHDLEIDVSTFRLRIDRDGTALSLDVDASSLRVRHALVAGRADPSLLTTTDRRKIERQIVEEVLHARQHPRVRFESDLVAPLAHGGYRVRGALHLHGVQRVLDVETRRLADEQVLELELHQPDYGIVPYRALLGALRVQAAVGVRLSVPSA
jgi:hypothetical protein